MAKLSISNNQNTQVIDPVDAHLESAFAEGVSAPSDSTALPAMQMYTNLTSAGRTSVRDSFRQAIAALLKVLNIDRPLPATKFSGTVALAKLTDLGSNGSLTVTDGIITAYSAPT